VYISFYFLTDEQCLAFFSPFFPKVRAYGGVPAKLLYPDAAGGESEQKPELLLLVSSIENIYFHVKMCQIISLYIDLII